jgi:site-specific recombinase XerD
MMGSPSPSLADNALADRLLTRYKEHLSGICGLAPTTIHYRLRYAGTLLTQLQLRQARQLRAITPNQIAQYVSAAGRGCKPSSGQVVACSARSFLRFLLLRGLISRDLAAAVPSFANWRLASLPKTVSRTELEKLVGSVNDSTPVGQRDRAALLCMTELGLRAADVASIRHDGADLSAGVLRLRSPKQLNEVELPMTRRLAAAIRRYLNHGRPACKTTSLFVIHRAPFGTPLNAIGIRNIVRRRATEAGLGDRIRGTHIIRHSVATQLINSGASIKQIADLLGHQSIDTTAIYAKVDMHSLANVALPWPSRSEVSR